MSDHGFLPVNDSRLEYRLIRPDAAKTTTIVLLHEGLGSVSAWGGFPEQLAQVTGCRVLVYSRVGYGRSDPAPDPTGTSLLQHEATYYLPPVLATVPSAHRLVLIGHSDGATIALIHAALGGDPVPTALVLMAPHVFVEERTMEGVRKAQREFSHGELRQRLQRHHGDKVAGAFYRWHGAWIQMAADRWQIESLLPRIKLPLLLIQGDLDEYGTLSQLRKIDTLTRGTTDTVVLPQCGHSPYREQPDNVLAATSRFFARAGLG